MGKAIGFSGIGDDARSAEVNAAPGQPTILDVYSRDTTPNADGGPRKFIAVRYAAPDPVGTFIGFTVFLDAPDTAGGLSVADGTVAADGTNSEAGVFQPVEIGFFAYNEGSPQFGFEYKAPSGIENWRIYLVPGSERRHASPVQAGLPGASVSKQFVMLPPASVSDGREFAPLVTNVALVDPADLEGWTTNPKQIQGESGDQSFIVAASWEWPTTDQNYQSLGGANIVLGNGTTQVYIGNVDKGAAPLWISAPQVLLPGTTIYTVYLESYDTKGTRNSQISGVTPSVQFSMVRQLGGAGVEYAARVGADGVHPLVAVTPLVGADGTSLLEVTAYWIPPADPRFGGVRLRVRYPGGAQADIQTGATQSPLQLHLSQPATVQTWRFFLVSVDINGNTNTVVDNSDGTHDAGETPWIDISVGNPNGQLNLAKAAIGTFSSEFQIASGALRLGNVSADVLALGTLKIGGGGAKVSKSYIYDLLGSLIGFDGDDSAASGFVGGWRKMFRIGGASPLSAQFIADTSGNISISGSLIVGAVPLATTASTATTASSASTVPAAGVTGTLPASQVGSGYLASALAGLIANSQLNTGISLTKLASGSLPVGVTYTGTLVASQVVSGTFLGLALTINSGGVTTTINNVFNSETSGYYGIRVSNNSVSAYSTLDDIGVYVRYSTNATASLRATDYLGSGQPSVFLQYSLGEYAELRASASPRLILRSNLLGPGLPFIQMNLNQVLTVRQTGPGNTTDSSDVAVRFNNLLTALRTHGLIT